jgi:hypothetical protein
MNCIVPLAGPDFFNPKYGIKPLIPYKGKKLLEYLLTDRPWYRDIKEFIFILQDTPFSQEFIQQIEIPNARFIKITNTTKGALLTSVAAISIIHYFSEPLVLDLTDIEYDNIDFNPKELFAQTEIAGIIPYFNSNDSAYSYVIADDNNMLLSCAEKKVISNKASAGTYFFKDAMTFLQAVSGVLNNADGYFVNDSLYICPAYNELLKLKKNILTTKVNLVESVSKKLKNIN